jgi:DNA-binding transcriptional ArsR family regulator
MDARTPARFEARAQVLKALAHPSRLYMVDVLAQGERCVYSLKMPCVMRLFECVGEVPARSAAERAELVSIG